MQGPPAEGCGAALRALVADPAVLQRVIERRVQARGGDAAVACSLLVHQVAWSVAQPLAAAYLRDG